MEIERVLEQYGAGGGALSRRDPALVKALCALIKKT